MNKKAPPDAALSFARFAGEMAESFSFNRSIGQIYGLLYISDTPLALEDIASRLSISKGNASVNVRALESWGAVRKILIDGNRRDFYRAETDLKALALRRLEEGLGRRWDMAESRLAEILPGIADRGTADRVKRLQGTFEKGRKMLKALSKMDAFFSPRRAG